MSSFSQRSRSRTGVSDVAGRGRSMTATSALPHVEQRGLAGDPVALGSLPGGERVVEPEQDLGRVPERVERAHPGERLEDLPVGEPEVDPRAEVGEGAERAALLARRDDRLDRALAHVLDREQAEPDRVALDREVDGRPVDVGRADLDPQPAALRDRRRHLLRVVAERGEDGGHVLDGEVRLEVGGLVRDQAVARRVGLVEPVALERLERLEHGVDRLRGHAAVRRTGSTNVSFIERRTDDFFFRIA